MKNSVEIYIKKGIDNSSTTYSYKRLELFESEKLHIKSKIQDIRDISKVFTEFSKEFTVPASEENNKIFTHYYDFRIVNGFDARFKMDGFIKIDGMDYKKGKISLNSVVLENRVPKSYKIVFYGETVGLDDIIGDDELNDLQTNATTGDVTDIMAELSFVHTPEYVRDNLTEGQYLDSNWELQDSTGASDPLDYCFPFISAQNYYYWDNNLFSSSPNEGDSQSRNIKYESTSTDVKPRGINWLDLKPALSVRTIIRAIEERYDIEFDKQDFFSDTNLPFHKMFMWLHRERGYIENQINYNEALYGINDFTPTGTPLWNSSQVSFAINDEEYFSYTITLSNVPTGETWSLEIEIDGDSGSGTIDVPTQVFNGTGNASFTVDFEKGGGVITVDGAYTPTIKVISSGTLTAYDIGIEITETRLNVEIGPGDFEDITETYDFLDITGETFTSSGGTGVQISSQMPKMKIMDFITSLFKMYNLTAFFSEGKIKVETLDSYYGRGSRHDISRYVDTSNSNVKRSKLYSEVDMSFSEPKTFAIINSNEITGDEFGNEKLRNVFSNLNLRDRVNFDGGKYSVKPKFERMMFERMTSQTDGTLLDTQWGWSVTPEQNPSIGKPILFYVEKQSLTTPSSISFDKGDYDNFNESNVESITEYIKASNVEDTTAQSIHFGSEINEWNGNTLNKSLVNEYWLNYIKTIYDKSSRIFKIEAQLPSYLISTIELNDIIIIDGIEYRINEMDINLSTGNVKFELFNDLGYYD